MHRAVVLLTCACAVFAQQRGYRPFRPHIKPISAYNNPMSIYRDAINPYPSIQNPWLELSGVQREFEDTTYPTFLDNRPMYEDYFKNGLIDSSDEIPYLPLPHDESSSLQAPPTPWNPPPYRQHLKDVEEAISRERSHFTDDGIKDKDDKNFRYIVIEHVVNQLSKEVIKNGWQSYNSSYPQLVKTLIHSAVTDPQGAVWLVDCERLIQTEKRIKKIIEIVNDPIIHFVCVAQPSSCDALIWATIRRDPAADTLVAARTLEIAADAASTFLKEYSSAFEAISTQNAYRYLILAKDELRPLVSKYATLKQFLIEQGEPIECLLK